MFLRQSFSRKALKCILIGTAAVLASAAIRLYYVQEMLAALLFVAVVFCCAGAILLALFMLDRVGEAVFGFLESHGKALVEHAFGRRLFSDRWYRI